MSIALLSKVQPKSLVELGRITPQQLQEFSEDAERQGRSVVEYMLAMRTISERDLYEARSLQRGLPWVDIADVDIPEDISGLIKHKDARELQVIPFKQDGTEVFVATQDHSDITLETRIRALIPGRPIRLVDAYPKDLQRRVEQIYSASREAEVVSRSVSEQAQIESLRRSGGVDEEGTEDSSSGIQQTVRLIILDGIARGASDIHIEPHEFHSQVRYEVDGIVEDGMTNNLNIHNNIISSIKVMANMGLDDRIRSSGRIEFMFHNKQSGKREQIDLRVESLPTVRGQRITMRILDNQTAKLPLSSLGFSDTNYQRFQRAYQQPIGLVLMNGPTGSGKSTTLYSTLNEVATPEKTIYTVENPVEYHIDGISQVQVNEDAGLTWGEALKGFMRMAPKILLIGEIRDTETANLAIDFALTGHLVLSTLHANDAPLAISRLLKMGVDPFLVADSLECSVAQRLYRKLCVSCKQAYKPTPLELRKVGISSPEGIARFPEVYGPVGCDECRGTGYRGRSSIHEVMLMNDVIAEMVAGGAPASEIRKEARSEGMVPMISDGLERIMAGETSIGEIARVIRVR